MSDRFKVLFICSKNQWRSPTAEAIYRDDPRISVRSRGTASAAARKVSEVDLEWADLVLVMEQKHRSRLLSDYPGVTKHLPIAVLDIPDDYPYMDAELIRLLQMSVEPLLDDFQKGPPPQS